MIKESFVLRVLAAIFIFLAMPLLVICFILFQNDYQDAIKSAKRDVEVAANTRTYSLYQMKPFSLNFVHEVIYYLDLKNWPQKNFDEMNRKLHVISKKVDGGLTLSLLEKGEEFGHYTTVASSNESFRGKSFTSFARIPSIEGGGLQTYIGTRYVPEKQMYEFNIHVVQAILDDEKQLLGFLIVTANIDDEIKLILEEGRQGTEQFGVVHGEGVICAANDRDLVGEYLKPLSEREKIAFLGDTRQEESHACLAKKPLNAKWEKDSNFLEFAFKGETKIAYLSPLNEIGLSVLAYANKEDVFSASMQRFLFFYISYGLLLILSGAATVALSHLLSRPLQQLSGLFREFQEGKMNRRFREEKYGYEINALGLIFNETIDAFLQNAERAENYRIAKETNKRELEIGYEVQRRLLPEKLTHVQGIETFAQYEPAEIAGGDFYDFIEHRGKLYFLIGDTATKGITPCLYALILRSLIRSYVQLEEDVGKILTHSNKLFCKDTSETGIFVTLLMGSFDPETKILKYYSCGHPPGILRKKNGHIELLAHRGIALGLSESAEFESYEIQLESGDLLLFSTQGLYRSTNERHQYFGMERVMDALQHRNWVGAEEVGEGLLEEVRDFRALEQDSEITIVVLRVL